MLAICHTYYSLQTGVRSPDDWARTAVERGYAALAVADINGLYGAVEFSRAARKHGLKPLIGCQLQVNSEDDCIVLATSDCGYRQLCEVLTARHLQPTFNFRLSLEATGFSDLIFLSRSPAVLRQLSELVPGGNLYALPATPARAGGRHSANNTPLLWDTFTSSATVAPVPDAWFIDACDRQTFNDLGGIRQLAGRSSRPSSQHPGALLPTAKEWRKKFGNSHIAQEITDRCEFQFTLGRPILPQIQLPDGENAVNYLRKLCQTAWNQHYQTAPKRQQAQERLNKELMVIEQNGFCDYFLYVNEIIQFARQRRIPVEVRGSAASSIVSFLLGFTHCCPLEHDLYFERFMNPSRRDCPDIDVDIADNRREEVINFCYQRWGENHVAMVSTIQTYQTRGALRDAGRLLGYKPEQVSRLLQQEPQANGNGRHRQLFRTAARLVGIPRHLGVHCGGLLITPMPLTQITPLARARKGVIVSHFEKNQAEAIGLIKMDLLGNSALSLIDEAIQSLRQRGLEFPENGPAYDYKVNRLFANGDTIGIYQCESPGMRQLCAALKPRSPKETAIALSLIRPGPAAAGMKDTFIRRRRGLEAVTYLHPKMAEFLSATYGVMLYQEDVMKVAVTLAGYTMADADTLRRAVKKLDSEAFRLEKNRFIAEKANAAGIDLETADEIWRQVTRFASYSYCKAHASVYGRLAWITARLKTHYPREFFAAALNWHKSMYPKRVLAWDAMRHQIPVLPVDINRSQLLWTPTPNGIRAGLNIVQGLRETVARQIVAEQRRQPFATLRDLRQRIDFQAGELEGLILIAACSALGTREELWRELQDTGNNNRQLTLFNTREIQLPPLLDTQLTLTGIPFSTHPVTEKPGENCCTAAEMPNFLQQNVTMNGILDAVKCVRTKPADNKPEKEMSFATLEDATGMFELVFFPEAHAKFANRLKSIGPYRVRGTIKKQWDSLVLEVEQLEIAVSF